MAFETLEDALELFDGDDVALRADEFDDCIVGIGRRCGQPDLIIYDVDKIIATLMEQGNMSFEDAHEFYEHNIVGAWVGEGTPIYMNRIEGR